MVGSIIKDWTQTFFTSEPSSFVSMVDFFFFFYFVQLCSEMSLPTNPWGGVFNRVGRIVFCFWTSVQRFLFWSSVQMIFWTLKTLIKYFSSSIGSEIYSYSSILGKFGRGFVCELFFFLGSGLEVAGLCFIQWRPGFIFFFVETGTLVSKKNGLPGPWIQ